jgi:hypothetical protein
MMLKVNGMKKRTMNVGAASMTFLQYIRPTF